MRHLTHRPPSSATVGRVVATGIALTALHFADNTFNIEDYPAPGWQPDRFEFAVAAFWIVFSAVGVLGYRSYRDGDFSRAHPLLAFYALTGLISLGHFSTASPGDLTTFGLITVLVDAVAGCAVLGVVIWSVGSRRADLGRPVA
ncbi:MAG: hypothetical protein WAP37_00165 [Solirubrobacterales bacterium]